MLQWLCCMHSYEPYGELATSIYHPRFLHEQVLKSDFYSERCFHHAAACNRRGSQLELRSSSARWIMSAARLTTPNDNIQIDCILLQTTKETFQARLLRKEGQHYPASSKLYFQSLLKNGAKWISTCNRSDAAENERSDMWQHVRDSSASRYRLPWRQRSADAFKSLWSWAWHRTTLRRVPSWRLGTWTEQRICILEKHRKTSLWSKDQTHFTTELRVFSFGKRIVPTEERF